MRSLLLLAVVVGATSVAQRSATAGDAPSTTVITHGFQLFTTSKPGWMQDMGEEILLAAGGQGAVLRYVPATGQWQQAAGNASSADAPLVLLFNWADESDGATLPGTNIGYAEAAADALYAALRAPGGVLPFDAVAGRTVHFIGHSRGCCVNSEVVRRLANAALPVDQVTTLDPHPVAPPMAESCGLGGGLNWGDQVPVRWSNVAFADNYWRADTGLAGSCHDCDFDGMVLPAAQVYNVSLAAALGEAGTDTDDCLLGCRLEHSKTHTWYHGTIAGAASDVDCAVNSSGTWYSSAEAGCSAWTCAGYAHSAVRGGARPALSPGTAPTPADVLYNGAFDRSYAGWGYHGGSGAATVVLESGTSNSYLRLEPTKPSRRHNRFYLPRNAVAVQLDTRVFTASADDVLQVRMVDSAGTVRTVGSLPLTAVTAGWVTSPVLPLGADVPRGVAMQLELALASPVGSLTAVAGADSIVIQTAGAENPLGDLNADGVVDGTDLGLLLGSWGPCAAQPCTADLSSDGLVDGTDLGLLLGAWTG